MAQTPQPVTVADIIRPGIELATATWLQNLPDDQQMKLPQDPLQAFRLVHDDPDVVFPWYRYDMIQSANRVADIWYERLPAFLQQRLSRDPLEALQSIVLRLQFIQRPRAASTLNTSTTASPPSTPVQHRTAHPVSLERPQQQRQYLDADTLDYDLPPAPRFPHTPQEVVYDPNSHSLDVAQSFRESREREMQRLLQNE